MGSRCEPIPIFSREWIEKRGRKSVGGVLYGKITAHLTDLFTDEEEAVFLDWVSGQNSDGLGEGFEQRAIRTGDGEM